MGTAPFRPAHKTYGFPAPNTPCKFPHQQLRSLTDTFYTCGISTNSPLLALYVMKNAPLLLQKENPFGIALYLFLVLYFATKRAIAVCVALWFFIFDLGLFCKKIVYKIFVNPIFAYILLFYFKFGFNHV